MIPPDIHNPYLLPIAYTHLCEKVSYSEKEKEKVILL